MNGRRSHALAFALLAWIPLWMVPGPAPAEDQVGLYFDPAFTSSAYTGAATGGLVETYLVLHDPTAPGGVGGWELCIDAQGPVQFLGYQYAGQAVNPLTPPCFAVGLAEPLPPVGGDVLLMTFFAYVEGPEPIGLLLKPKWNASLPDMMSYLDAADITRILPLTTVTGHELVATINDLPPQADISPAGLVFPELMVGGGEDTRSFHVTNVGGGILSLDISLVDNGPEFWLPGVSGRVDLLTGETVTIPVTFAPVELGPASCTLSLGPGNPTAEIIGTGREPIIEVHVNPIALDFGEVLIGTTVSEPVIVTNAGEAAVTLDRALADPAGPFAITNFEGPTVVQPGNSAYIYVRFTPTAAGTFTNTLLLGPVAPEVPLSGIGILPLPQYQYVPEQLVMPDIGEGYSTQGEVRILNTGLVDIPIDPELTGADPGFSILVGDYPGIVTPGHSRAVTIGFDATVPGDFTATLQFGPGLDPVPVSVHVVPAQAGCVVSQTNVAFSPTEIGVTSYRTVTVTNTGTIPLTGPVTVSGAPYFEVLPPAIFLDPGQQQVLSIGFAPGAEGFWTAEIALAGCSTILCSGSGIDGGFGGGEATARIYFDPGFTSTYTYTQSYYEMVTGFVVLEDCPDPLGVQGWECCFALDGDAEFLGWQLEGQTVNVLDPPCFAVGLGSPLPSAQHILLGTFFCLVETPWSEVLVMLGPTDDPTIPGFSSYLPAGDPENPQPMQGIAGPQVMAVINHALIGVEAPTPRAAVADGGVDLSWRIAADEAVDGCHVFRRLQDAQTAERLTDRPLTSMDNSYAFTDPAIGLPAGSVVRYSYAIVQDGTEKARSPEVGVTLGGVPVTMTRLLPNVPNPFNPQTEIRFELEREGMARVTVYDLTGRLVAVLVDETLGAGPHGTVWQGRDDMGRPLPSGAYYVRLETDGRVDHRKVMLLK